MENSFTKLPDLDKTHQPTFIVKNKKRKLNEDLDVNCDSRTIFAPINDNIPFISGAKKQKLTNNEPVYKQQSKTLKISPSPIVPRYTAKRKVRHKKIMLIPYNILILLFYNIYRLMI